jgi:flagellar basal body P-ring formation protein FlgA
MSADRSMHRHSGAAERNPEPTGKGGTSDVGSGFAPEARPGMTAVAQIERRRLRSLPARPVLRDAERPQPRRRRRARPAGTVEAWAVLRVIIAVAVLVLIAAPTLAAERPRLKGDITVDADVITLADLVEGARGPALNKPLFRAPALGERGTIQTARILGAIAGIGGEAPETEGRTQVLVDRAARRVGPVEIGSAVGRRLEAQAGLDAKAISLLLDGTPAMVVPPEVTTPLAAEEVAYDRRTRRFSALVAIPGAAGERRASLRVTGVVIETAEVAVTVRAIARGEVLQPGDIVLERRVKESVPSDAQSERTGSGSRVARRALAAGSVVRAGDLAKPELVAKGEIVSIVYEVPGLVLTLRGRANESGTEGDVIAVVNPQSKKVLQGTVVGPGKVSVSAAPPGRVAQAAPSTP